MQKLVSRAPRFEGICDLQVFKFQEHGAAAEFAQKNRMMQGSAPYEGNYGFSRILNVVKADHTLSPLTGNFNLKNVNRLKRK
jgi:hypothetical protein